MSLHRFIVASALILTGCFAAGARQQMLVVHTIDGGRTAFDLREEPKVSFSQSELIITTASTEFAYPLDITDRIEYEEKGSDIFVGIDTPDTDNTRPFVYTDDNLIITAPDTATTVSLHSSDGRLFLTRDIEAGATVKIKMPSLPSGVYLLTINRLTHKIIIK